MFAYLTHPAINPVILNIAGPFAIRWYSLMYILGFIAVYLFLFFRIKKKNDLDLTPDDLSDLIFVAILGVLVGGRLGYVLFYNLGQYIKNPLEIFKVWDGGMSFHGGLIFTILFEWFYLAKIYPKKHEKKLNFLDVADTFIIPVPIALFFGRLGNFINGELWGRPTTSKIGMLFESNFPTQGQPKSFPLDDVIPKLGMTAREAAESIHLPVSEFATEVNLPRYPSQLFEATLEGLVLFAVLFLLYKLLKNRPRGLFISVFLGGYGIARFLVEFVREPDQQLGYLLGTQWLTMGMILSIPMIILGALGIFFAYKVNQKNELWV